jgi:hypothetical protein
VCKVLEIKARALMPPFPAELCRCLKNEWRKVQPLLSINLYERAGNYLCANMELCLSHILLGVIGTQQHFISLIMLMQLVMALALLLF